MKILLRRKSGDDRNEKDSGEGRNRPTSYLPRSWGRSSLGTFEITGTIFTGRMMKTIWVPILGAFLHFTVFSGYAQQEYPAPQLVRPANGAQVYLSQIRSDGLHWESVPGAVKYEIEILGPSSFNQGFPYTTSTTTTNFVFGQNGALDTTFTGTYSWRVKSVFGSEEDSIESEFSEMWSFLVTVSPTPTKTPRPIPTPDLDVNNDNAVDYKDLFFLSQQWTPGGRNLLSYAPYFRIRNITPTPTPTPILSAPQSLQVLVNGQVIPSTQAIPGNQIGSVLLRWAPVTGGISVVYEVSVTAPQPQASVFYPNLSQTEIRPYAGYQGLYPGTYTWSVQAVDSLGNRSPVSVSTFKVSVGEPPSEVVTPYNEPDYDLNADGIFSGLDLFSFMGSWYLVKDDEGFQVQADYDKNEVVMQEDAVFLSDYLSRSQLPPTQFTTIDLYNAPQGGNPATYNRTVNAESTMAMKVFELAYCEIHFEPVEGAIDYEVTLMGWTNANNWPIGTRFRTGGQLSIVFRLREPVRFVPTVPGAYKITVRAIDPLGTPGIRSSSLNVALSY